MSVTCCPLSGTDDCGADFSKVTQPRAHHCCECYELIKVGDRYEHTTGSWDGQWSTYRTCLSCVEIRDHFACEGWLFGQVWQDIETNFFPDMRAGGPCMEGLSPAAKGRLFERRLAWLERSGS